MNRKMYHACMTLIRVLEDSLRANLEKQMQLIGLIEYLKSSGSKVTKGKKVLPNATKINTELKLPSMDPPNSTVCKTPKKSRGRPRRGANLCILDRRLMELLGSYKVIHKGRKMVTLYPGDVRRIAIITASTILLLNITDLTMPEDLSGLPQMYRETSRMAIELSRNGLHPGSPVEPFPPNMVLLTGLRGLLVESTRVDPYPEDFDEGDPIIDQHLMTIMKSFFGGWARPIFVLFALNGFVPAKTNENSNMGDPEAAEIFMNADDLPNGIIPCSSEAGNVYIGDGDEKAGGAIERTPKRSTRIKTPVIIILF